jgi:glycerol-3-phosphate O-acyltransferase/dihydroxyacetone phosphate acyltransferase
VLWKITKTLVRAGLKFFFEKIQVIERGKIPPTGPLIVTSNHPSSIMDVLIIAAMMPRRVRFLATGAMFNSRFWAKVLRAFGAIPIYQARNDPRTARRNVRVFSLCRHLLRKGEAIALFPEGATHSEQRLKELQRGVAHIALGAEAENDFGLNLQVCPVGLNYTDPTLFRSRVLVIVGRPMTPAKYQKEYANNPRSAEQSMTHDLQEVLRKHIVDIQRLHLRAVVSDIERIYKSELVTSLGTRLRKFPPPMKDFVIRKGIVRCIEFYDRTNPALVHEMWLRISRYRRQLSQLGIEQVLEGPQEVSFRTNLKYIVMSTLGLPFALYGLANNYIPSRIPGIMSNRLSKHPTQISHLKFWFGFLAFPTFYFFQMMICRFLFGAVAAVLYVISLPLSGLFAVKCLHATDRLRRYVSYLSLSVTRRKLIAAILKERAAIVREIERRKEEYLSLQRRPREVPAVAVAIVKRRAAPRFRFPRKPSSKPVAVGFAAPQPVECPEGVAEALSLT